MDMVLLKKMNVQGAGLAGISLHCLTCIVQVWMAGRLKIGSVISRPQSCG